LIRLMNEDKRQRAGDDDDEGEKEVAVKRKWHE
jgi:hypothetical protein